VLDGFERRRWRRHQETLVADRRNDGLGRAWNGRDDVGNDVHRTDPDGKQGGLRDKPHWRNQAESSPKSGEKEVPAATTTEGEVDENHANDMQTMQGQDQTMQYKHDFSGHGPIKTGSGALTTPMNTSLVGLKEEQKDPEELGPLVPVECFQKAVERIQDGEGKLDYDAVKLLEQLAEEFAEECLQMGGAMAQHRGSKKMEIKDVMTYLERQYHMRVPGFGPPNLGTFQRRKDNPIHRERLAAVRRASAQDAAEALKRKRKEAAAYAAQKEAAEARERKAEEAAREEEEDEEKRGLKEARVEANAE